MDLRTLAAVQKIHELQILCNFLIVSLHFIKKNQYSYERLYNLNDFKNIRSKYYLSLNMKTLRIQSLKRKY